MYMCELPLPRSVAQSHPNHLLGGPTAACFGCVGFAGFSLVVDKIMGPH